LRSRLLSLVIIAGRVGGLRFLPSVRGRFLACAPIDASRQMVSGPALKRDVRSPSAAGSLTRSAWRRRRHSRPLDTPPPGAKSDDSIIIWLYVLLPLSSKEFVSPSVRPLSGGELSDDID